MDTVAFIMYSWVVVFAAGLTVGWLAENAWRKMRGEQLPEYVNGMLTDLEMIGNGRDYSGEALSREDMRRIAKKALEYAYKELK
jgi:hypothetical protein